MVVSSSGKKGLRSFKPMRVVNHEGCDTKFDKNSRLVSRNPRGAAMKALSDLCLRKSIKNRCTFLVGIKETTQGSKKKEYIYKCKREKLSKPLSLKLGKANVTFKYKTSAKSKKSFPKCKGRSKQGKSSGPMKNKPSKKGQN